MGSPSPAHDDTPPPQLDGLPRILGLRANTLSDDQGTALDDPDSAEPLDLPDADLSEESLSVTVVPVQPDEFVCSRCLLVQHRNRLVWVDNHPVCADCL
ncbi:hypothetical protein BST41_29770 [Mycolicibacterium porcinum]|nr:hypothetical protein BST41_29770 [Mycolicibacterium porcinum]